MFGELQTTINLGQSLRPIRTYLTQPVRLFKTYDRVNLKPDLIAGLTVAVILLPQSIAFALIADLPPQMGIYTAVIAAIVGGLWGSSDQTHTGPTNAISLLVLSVLLRELHGRDGWIHPGSRDVGCHGRFIPTCFRPGRPGDAGQFRFPFGYRWLRGRSRRLDCCATDTTAIGPYRSRLKILVRLLYDVLAVGITRQMFIRSL